MISATISANVSSTMSFTMTISRRQFAAHSCEQHHQQHCKYFQFHAVVSYRASHADKIVINPHNMCKDV